MIRALVVAVIIVLSGCAANNQAAIQQDQQDESFADRIDDSILSSNPNQQKCLEGRLPMVKIGVDPVNPYQFNPKTEDRYKIKIPIFVRTKGKKGKEVSGCIPPGTVVVAKKGDTKMERIFECGNPVLNDIYLPGSGRTTKQSAVARASKDEKSCFTAGNFATGLGTGLLSFGLSTGEPISITAGAILSLTGLFDDKVYGSNSDHRCKAAFGIVGGSGGYSYGKSYNDSQKDSSSTSSNNGGDTGGNGNGDGNGNSNGPATPPPVP